ncbi:MAG: serine/threonine protein kinase [Planctomycetes bacterium]|nr:serine/threonine protein kinase [Planctomycetota bacterium]
MENLTKRIGVARTFRNSAVLSGLITREQIAQSIEMLTAQLGLPPGSEISEDELAAKLVELGAITSYQADQLRVGRTKLNLGPYIITDFIAAGGMGQVFKAVHKMMGRECAVKVLPRNLATEDRIQNFTKEIRTQAQLDHPHLVRAYDAGHDGKVHFLVTEYVPGTDLRRLVRSRGPLPMQLAASIIFQAASGLEYAHNRDLIHRDVKPGNILVTPDGVAKVSDLGLSFSASDSESDPRLNKIVGTPDYLSPEQIKSPREITRASDIYSLGCTLYYAVCGKVPFPGGSPSEKAKRHLEETPWHPRRFNPEISEEFVEVIGDMMEKSPDKRIQSAQEVAARLEPWAGEANPIPSLYLTNERWTAPPIPTGREVETGRPDFVPFDVEDFDSRSQESPSQLSQGTDPLVSGRHDTTAIYTVRRGRSIAPPFSVDNDPEEWSRGMCVAMALAISIPVSMLFGALLTFLVLHIMARG